MTCALEIDIKNTDILFALIDKYLGLFCFMKAESLITEFIKKYPNELNYRIKRLEIITAQDKYYSHYYEDLIIERNYIRCLNKHVDYNLLIEDYTELLNYNKNAIFYKNRAYAYGILGQNELKINDLKSAISLDPTLVKCYVDIANIYLANKDNKTAIIYYTQALKQSIYDFNISSELVDEIYTNRSLAYEGLKDYKSALDDLKSYKERNSGYLYEYGCKRFIKYAFLSENYVDALALIKEKKIDDYFLIPYVYKKLDNKKSQINYYKQCLKNKEKLCYEQKNYLQIYKRLMVLKGKNKLYPVLRLKYLSDKIFGHAYSIYYHTADLIRYLLDKYFDHGIIDVVELT